MIKLHIDYDKRSRFGRKRYKTRLSSTVNSNYLHMDRLTKSDMVVHVAAQAVFTGQTVQYTGIVVVAPNA